MTPLEAATDAERLAEFAPSEEWRRALHEAPRRRFIPESAWAGPNRWIDRRADPTAWQQAVCSDTVIVTQIDDGATPLTAESAERTVHHSCSCSAPSLVFRCLGLLDLDDHHRVLEIGTGTGWTAGLLSARLGEAHVTSIEVDTELATTAVANLAAAGLSPTVVVADGAAGWPQDAPYDRVHVTCGVRQVPHAWVTQTRPGGVIVLPLVAGFGTGCITRLDVLGDGTAVGAFTDQAWYMPLRAQRTHSPLYPWATDVDGDASTTRFDPRTLASVHGGGAGVMLSAYLPDVEALLWAPEPDGETTYWLLETGDNAQSWAAVDYQPGAVEFQVEQYGPRRLWDDAEAAYLDWLAWGRPGLDRFGLTVTPDSQHVWIDTSDHPIG